MSVDIVDPEWQLAVAAKELSTQASFTIPSIPDIEAAIGALDEAIQVWRDAVGKQLDERSKGKPGVQGR